MLTEEKLKLVNEVEELKKREETLEAELAEKLEHEIARMQSD
jgi:hypothetical protein